MNKFLNSVKKNLYNIPGWHTARKIIVFESDDWGSIRIPSVKVNDILQNKNIQIKKTPYHLDSLENNDDIQALGEVLREFYDKNGNHPVFTINNIIANPDFAEIKKSDFKTYQYELFHESYSKNSSHNKCMQLWNAGINDKIFHFQFHGREHLNVKRWMTALQSGMPETRFLFDLEMFGLPASLSSEIRRDYQRAFDMDAEDELDEKCTILEDGLSLFEKTWGYKSNSFIPPNYFWNDSIESKASLLGVNFFQGQYAQFKPDFNGGYKAIHHFTGERNKIGMIYLVRNCYFEPALFQYNDINKECIKEIASSFRFHKPAIVSSHRLNFIGSINPLNREMNLKLLKKLLTEILIKWPDVEFMTSDALGKLITKRNNK